MKALCHLVCLLPLGGQILYAQLTEADIAIAQYLNYACLSSVTEHMVFYSKSQKKVHDISTPGSASLRGLKVDWHVLKRFLESGDHVVLAHCHIVDYTHLKKSPSQEKVLLYKKVLESNKDLVRKHFRADLPSGIDTKVLNSTAQPVGDYITLMSVENVSYKINKLSELSHRLVVVEDGQPAKVFSYGLKCQAMIELRDQLLPTNPQGKSVNQETVSPTVKQIGLALEYNKILDVRTAQSCRLLEPKAGCIRIDPEEVMRRINASEKFFVKLIGTYQLE